MNLLAKTIHVAHASPPNVRKALLQIVKAAMEDHSGLPGSEEQELQDRKNMEDGRHWDPGGMRASDETVLREATQKLASETKDARLASALTRLLAE